MDNIIERIDEAINKKGIRKKLQELDDRIDEFMDMLEDKAVEIEDNPMFQKKVLQLLADTTKEHGEFFMALKKVAQALDGKSQMLGKTKPVGKPANTYVDNGDNGDNGGEEEVDDEEVSEIVKTIDQYLNETTQVGFVVKMTKGFHPTDGVGPLAISLWHYYNVKPSPVSGVFKSQPSKNIMDELWFRLAKSWEKSERLTDDGIKKLKKNFYSFSKLFNNKYKLDKLQGAPAWIVVK